jgi:hypothetical protein
MYMLFFAFIIWASVANMMYFIGYVNNYAIKFTVYFTLHMRIARQIMNINIG